MGNKRQIAIFRVLQFTRTWKMHARILLATCILFFSETLSDSYKVTAFDRTSIQESGASQSKHIIVKASRSSTLTLCLFETPLNNLDLLGSGKTHKSQSYDVIRVKGQDCVAYTARLAAAFEQALALFILTSWNSYRILETQRSWSQKHTMTNFLLTLNNKYICVHGFFPLQRNQHKE